MNKILIAPSILASDFLNIGSEIEAVLDAGADWIHVDVMDGHFVPPLTIGPQMVSSIRKNFPSVFLDVHLMILNAAAVIDQYIEAGASGISVHFEACAHLHYLLQDLKSKNILSSVAINPGTSMEVLKPVLGLVDMVLVMSVNPGWGGQKLIPETLQKISQLVEYREKHQLAYRIQIDGGVSEKNAAAVAEAGADVLVAGSAIFKTNNYASTVVAIRKAAESAVS
jgi:ribulose-phosphate 3-epimerase